MRSLSARLTDRQLLQRGDLTLCWRARDRVLDRPVFVKVLNPALAQDTEIRARFEREAKAVARLDHPNLVRIYEYGEDPDEGMYMILEWVDGQTLAQQIEGGRRFGGNDFLCLARELLSGLSALHSVGILHRDLKPENVLVRATPERACEFKITDFSLAALRDAPKLTHHEAIVGTPAYMAPEQAAGAQPTERSDLFSLGVVLYEAATGENPLIGETMLDTLRRIRESDISFRQPAVTVLSPAAQRLLEKLLRKNPADRPPDAREALALLDGGSTANEPDTEPTPVSRNLRYALMAAVIVAVGILLLRIAGNSDHPEGAAVPDTTWSRRQPASMLRDSGGTIPELRNPLPVDTFATADEAPTVVDDRRPTPEQPPLVSEPVEARVRATHTDTTVRILPDSVDLSLTTEPWAHVFYRGTQIGTTPLGGPLRLAPGDHVIVLRNPAFPPIDIPVTIRASAEITVRLAQHVARVTARVEPWGELYIDGEHIGTTPLTRPVYISPGRHAVRVLHPQLGSLQRDINAGAGQVLDLEVNLRDGTFLVATDMESQP